MKKFMVKTKKPYPVMVGEKLENVGQYCPDNMVIITDKKVFSIYGDKFPKVPVIKIAQGEGIKTLSTVHDIYGRLIDMNIDRTGFILGIGGGIVSDIAGFVASTYLRGLDFGFVASTLLSQVDASVGGKNGVNYRGYKNMVGVFNQPEFVIADTSMLNTLPKDELLNGFGEIVKHGAIADYAYFEFLENNYTKALALDKNIIMELVYGSVKIKAEVVNRDELEQGERRKLNFGHTFGHAFEKTIKIPHGRAVAAGMDMAVKLSEAKGLLLKDQGARINALIKALGFSPLTGFDNEKIVEALKKDKKREGKNIKFVLLTKIGNAIVDDISLKEIHTFL